MDCPRSVSVDAPEGDVAPPLMIVRVVGLAQAGYRIRAADLVRSEAVPRSQLHVRRRFYSS